MTDATTSNLLETITSLRMAVGDGLNDEELTRFFLQEAFPSEDGFTFVCLCKGWVTFRVPPQNLVRWYPETGWITPAKEAIARSIAEECGLSLFEPPDEKFSYSPAESDGHHHLEMSHESETVVIAHPRYLKIRLLDSATQRPLKLPKDLLGRLAALYLEHFAALYRT
jgi:hypothetical protein